jgi:hypothetical protein
MCEVPNCEGEVFAICSCTDCSGLGPFLCEEHFNSEKSCKLVRTANSDPVVVTNGNGTASNVDTVTNVGTVSNVNGGGTENKEAYLQRQKKFVDHFTGSNDRNNKFTLTDAELRTLELEVPAAENAKKKTSKQYKLLQRFEYAKIGEQSCVIKRRKSDSEKPLKVVSLPEAFTILHTMHVQSMHARTNIMCTLAKKEYYNITRKCVEFFLSLCETCAAKVRMPVRGVVVKPVRSHQFCGRCQVDLMDFQSHVVDGYRWILNYQDHFSKFLVLRALKSKRAEEIANQLTEIITLLGPPRILQSDNGREFVNAVLMEIKVLWPDLIIVNGRPSIRNRKDQ